VFSGGPVQPNAVIGLAAMTDGAAADRGIVRPLEPAPLAGLATVDLDADAAVAGTDVARLRVFAGYAGWAAGQLDDELVAGGWFVVDAVAGDAFTADPAALWRAVLARQRGRLAIFATCPEDPSLN
jgi:putative transcriptional regulator